MNWGCDQLATYLRGKGVTPAGIESVQGNGITGEMFLQFCEEDIRDAFVVFKDRFTVRKVLRELKSTQNTTGQQRAVPPPPCRPERTSNQSNLDQQRAFHIQRNSSISKSQTTLHNQSPDKYLNISQKSSNSSEAVSPQGLKRKLTPDHVKREPPEMRSEESGVCIDLRPEVPESKPIISYSTSFPQLMNATVSSTEEQVRSKSKGGASPSYSGEPYPVAVTRITNNSYSYIRGQQMLSLNHSPTATAERDQTKQTAVCKFEPSSPTSMRNLTDHVTQSQGHTENDTSQLDDQGTFMLSLVTSSISRFSGEELLAKKSVRGRPTEAQRLGTVLIRNAAQSVRIWDSAPLLTDIPQEKRDAFMRYVVSTAPQLYSHTELVWNRLREALQNRRKYLLDKKTGRRVLKGSSTSLTGNNLTEEPVHISNVHSLIDLTEQNDEKFEDLHKLQ